MLPTTLLTTALTGFMSSATTTVSTPFHKIAFDLDRIGRSRQTALIEETARAAYENTGVKVNIAVWNMHIPESHHFDQILETGLQPMGAGGGFRVVVFRGQGWLRNDGSGLEGDNWRYSGNLVVRNNLVEFGHADGCGYFWGCMGSTYGDWMQKLW